MTVIFLAIKGTFGVFATIMLSKGQPDIADVAAPLGLGMSLCDILLQYLRSVCRCVEKHDGISGRSFRASRKLLRRSLAVMFLDTVRP